jgi:hypothetical protein
VRFPLLSLVSRAFLGLAAIGTAACAVSAKGAGEPEGDPAGDESALTGTTSVERAIHFQGVVYVPDGSSDDVVKTAIARQVKTAIGGLRATKVALNDRGALHNLDPAKWTRLSLGVVDPATPSVTSRRVLAVTYQYDDRAVVTNTLASRSAVSFTMLADDYAAHADALKSGCSDDKTTDVDSLWYHFAPELASCKTAIANETTAISKEVAALGGRVAVIGPKQASRWYLPVTAKLDAPLLPAHDFAPEYDRLLKIASNQGDGKLEIYAFFGVDQNVHDPDDALAQEAARFLRSLLRAQPNFRPVRTEPFTYLLDFSVDGQKLSGVSYEQMLGWILDKSGYPAQVGADAAKIADLRRQAIDKLAERWIDWDLPVTVTTSDGTRKALTIEVKSFYGVEDGTADARQHAQWRYLEAFWYADVFLYNGHSHFGHGPLEPTNYGPQNFNDRYQLMMINSCISFNYYHQDFLAMKPGGSKNLDVIVNGLPSWVWGGGEVAARLVNGLVGGQQPTYPQLLQSMRLDMPWGEKAYDPSRVVDGELDNAYASAKSPLKITVGAPVY